MARPDDISPGAFGVIVRALALGWAMSMLLAPGVRAEGDDNAPTSPQDFAFHGQFTFTDQGNLAFKAPYSGPQSLPPIAEGRETTDVTAFIGIRPWANSEIWINPEFDQGFGLHNTLGAAGFPSGEAYKVGRDTFYLRLQRLFLRQTFDLGGASSNVDPDINQLGGAQSKNRLVITVGRFGVTDVFDTFSYAHDPRADFLIWAIIDAGTFDYAADAWGYTVGASAEWRQGPWTLRLGVFDLSKVPNSEKLDTHFGQFQAVGEAERRFSISGKKGALKITGFLSRGRMGLYSDAGHCARRSHSTPSAPKRRPCEALPLLEAWDQTPICSRIWATAPGSSPEPVGQRAMLSHTSSPTSTKRSQPVSRSRARDGGERATPWRSAESSTRFQRSIRSISPAAALGSSSATDDCRIRGQRIYLRPTTTLACRRFFTCPLTINSWTTPPTTPIGDR